MKKCAVFPGSFDPFTRGHLNVLVRAAALFDEVRVCVLHNASKRARFTQAERVEMIRLAIEEAGLTNARAESFDGLTARYAQEAGAVAIVRGLRGAADYVYEAELEAYNRLLVPGVETVYFSCPPELAHISSGAVRELLHYHADIGTLVPDRIYKYIFERLKDDEQ